MTGGAAIFVKTPGHSPLKTRLAEGIGAAAASEFHRLAAATVAATLGSLRGVVAYWAVAEATPEALGNWRGLPCLAQGEGALGERMRHVHERLLAQHSFALLLGADTPQLDPRSLAQAVAWLSDPEPRLVMGAARDGGFWLLGANITPAPADWLEAACGQPDTAAGFRAAMNRHGRWLELETLTDVDRAGDLPAMLSEFERLPRRLPAQARLVAWARALAPRFG